MDNKNIRRKILEILYEYEQKYPTNGVTDTDLNNKLDIKSEKIDFNINYLIQKGLITSENYLGGYFVRISHNGIDLIENNGESKANITQHFHGDVEQLALGDINNYNTKIYFDALIKAIEESEEIPEEDKASLIDKIKTIAHDPYVVGIGASAIFEGIKSLSMGVKPF